MNMAARYRGTCIGGVADGHYIERDDPQIVIKAARKNGEGEQILDETPYKFLLLLGGSNVEIGVWSIPDWPLEKVIERLVRCYNPRTGLIGTPQPNALPIRRQ